MQVLGMDVALQLPNIVPRLGAIVEEPGLIKGLNGRDNLRVAAHTLGRGHDKIDELLAFAGLTADARRRIDGYSKGMRQRLALAASLLGDPELLFLDEPLDGLDPAGQAQIKASLRQLAADGRTIVVSSHNLGDVEAMADEVIVINHGRLVTQSSLQQILGGQTGHVVEVSDPGRAVEALVAAGIPASVTDGRVIAQTDRRQRCFPDPGRCRVVPIGPLQAIGSVGGSVSPAHRCGSMTNREVLDQKEVDQRGVGQKRPARE